ncbi:SDR family oxidoreductase [Bacillus luteolus]|uniref:SDR family oxidoreductase n=1 Tax=Litchfieldia luteola TaxID=682179 RepID=A0ABR9QQ77_9BACI|nr:SDR family oxidoreductase [Cytobacillus luteolus]
MTTRTALLTGSASGLGKRTAIELAQKGINTVINYRNSEKEASELKTYITENFGVECTVIQGDIASVRDCEKIIHHCIAEHSHIDILINNAGPYVHERKHLIDYDMDEWKYIIDGNLNGVFCLLKYFVPKMREKKWGRIINFGFERADTAPGWIYRSAFAAAKVGLVSLTKTVALEEAKYGITANMVSPGEIIGHWKESNILDAQGKNDENTPVGRPGTGEDIARTISFLCDEKSDFITGSVIPITGGKDVLSKRLGSY